MTGTKDTPKNTSKQWFLLTRYFLKKRVINLFIFLCLPDLKGSIDTPKNGTELRHGNYSISFKTILILTCD